MNLLRFLPLSSLSSFFKKGLFLLSLLFFSKADAGHLQVRREYLNPCYLASSVVGTPDPTRCCFYGEEILIRYALYPCNEKSPSLRLHLLFGNREREDFMYTPDTWTGKARYRLLGEEYDCKGGVVAFKVELFSGDDLVESWCHPLWAEAIETHDSNL